MMHAVVPAAIDSPPNLSGAALAVFLAAITYAGTRKPKADQAAALVKSATDLAGAMSAELAALRLEVQRLAVAVAECEQKHQRAEAALRLAGIDMPAE